MNADAIVFFDGGCKSNPGRIAVAAVVCTPNHEVVIEMARDAGNGTNNVAEYRALAHAINMANLVGARQPAFVSDSALVVQQINGFWAMNGAPGSPLHVEHSRCYAMLMRFDQWSLKAVKRDQNKRADWLVSSYLGHSRTLKKAPPVHPVAADAGGRPGWKMLPSSRKLTHAAAFDSRASVLTAARATG